MKLFVWIFQKVTTRGTYNSLFFLYNQNTYYWQQMSCAESERVIIKRWNKFLIISPFWIIQKNAFHKLIFPFSLTHTQNYFRIKWLSCPWQNVLWIIKILPRFSLVLKIISLFVLCKINFHMNKFQQQILYLKKIWF
jgi:hypothetical protein